MPIINVPVAPISSPAVQRKYWKNHSCKCQLKCYWKWSLPVYVQFLQIRMSIINVPVAPMSSPAVQWNFMKAMALNDGLMTNEIIPSKSNKTV